MSRSRLPRFCPFCGTRLERRDDHGVTRPACPACDYVAYQNPSPAVAVLLPRRGGLVFVRRRYEPYAGQWSLPSGFMEHGEAPEETARREALEETGLEVRIDRLLGAYRGLDDPRVRVVLLVYVGSVVGGRARAGDDASEVRVYPVEEPPSPIAFRAHRQALRDYRRLLEIKA